MSGSSSLSAVIACACVSASAAGAASIALPIVNGIRSRQSEVARMFFMLVVSERGI